jgi:plasmid stability protein
MATLLIRNLDDAVRDKLRVRAAERGHSMEEEARSILASAIETEEVDPDSLPGSGATLVAELQAIFADLSAEEIDEFIAGCELPYETYDPPPIWDDEDGDENPPA